MYFHFFCQAFVHPASSVCHNIVATVLRKVSLPHETRSMHAGVMIDLCRAKNDICAMRCPNPLVSRQQTIFCCSGLGCFVAWCPSNFFHPMPRRVPVERKCVNAVMVIVKHLQVAAGAGCGWAFGFQNCLCV